MGNDIFGGLMKGLSGVLPQDDLNIKKFAARSRISGSCGAKVGG